MTQTMQPRSLVILSGQGKDLTMQKPETGDDRSLLLSVFDEGKGVAK